MNNTSGQTAPKMKSVQLSADLPPADSHIMLTYNSLPARPHRAMPRNKTGIYLGSDVPPNSPRMYHTVPPLARPRGTLFRPRTPTDKRRRQQRVEALRVREEPRGFHPQPVRKAKPKVKQDDSQSLTPNNNQAPVLRKSARNFVAAANSGVTHLEDLGLEELSLRSVSTGRESSIPPSIVEDIQNTNRRMVGLEECYSKICKGNLSSLQSLLPARKAAGATTGIRTKTVATPLTIRSFRNPRSPHSVVQYSDLRHKSKGTGAAKPPVPAPYYYSSKGLPNTTDDGGSKVRLTRLPASSRSTERVLAAPGVGTISQSALSRRASSLPSDPPPGIEGIPPPSLNSNAKFMDSEDHYAHKDGFRVPSGTPAVSATDLHKMGSSSSLSDGRKNSSPQNPRHPVSSEAQPTVAPPASPASTRKFDPSTASNKNNSHSIPTGLTNGHGSASESASDLDEPRPDPFSARSEEGSSRSSTLTQGDAPGDTQGDTQRGRLSLSSVTIVVSVENDSGESHVVDLEETVETEYEGDSQAGTSNEDSEQLIHEWQEASEKKHAELQRLLEEHQEIVSHIEELEKMTEQAGGSSREAEQEG